MSDIHKQYANNAQNHRRAYNWTQDGKLVKKLFELMTDSFVLASELSVQEDLQPLFFQTCFSSDRQDVCSERLSQVLTGSLPSVMELLGSSSDVLMVVHPDLQLCCVFFSNYLTFNHLNSVLWNFITLLGKVWKYIYIFFLAPCRRPMNRDRIQLQWFI